MTLAALLEELKEVDAEQSEKLQCWIGRTRQVMNLEMPLECDLAQALIQNSIQRACERRGWGECHGTWNGYPEAYIFYSPDNCSISLPHVHDSRAEALLSAYIAAVRAEAK